MAPDPRTSDAHGWGWLNTTTAPLPLHNPGHRTAEPSEEWEWISDPPPPEAGPRNANPTHRGHGMPMPPLAVWLSIAFGIAATIAIIALLAPTAQRRDNGPIAEPESASPSSTVTLGSAPPAIPSSPACTGLSGALVTATIAPSAGNLMAAIAGFEHAYYVARDPDAALRWLAPEAGIAAEPLAEGIASIPPGTQHCVAITPIAETTATVHLAERRPDGQRIDYLQLINVRAVEAGHAVITNIQRQGKP
ncbi:hypothetical protein ACWDYH_31170 [Nocardia goodfellowii]